jgi:hypothetical protein
VQQAKAAAATAQMAGVEIISRRELQQCQPWQRAFASQHKDSRYYEIVEDTLHPEFHYLYFAVRDCGGEIRTIQPSFIIDQDILAGVRVYCGGQHLARRQLAPAPGAPVARADPLRQDPEEVPQLF